MIEIKRMIDQAITLTEEGKPHQVNVPLLKESLVSIVNQLLLLKIKVDRLTNEKGKSE